jgi:hypothetical protein
MGHPNYVISLIKFVKTKDHAQDFLDGNLFCKPWASFKNLEDKQRGDRLEIAASKLKTKIYAKKVNRLYSFWLEDGDNQYTPIFCIYHVSSRDPKSSLRRIILEDERLREFGDYGVVVRNTSEFIHRINQRLPSFSYGLVNYIDYVNLPEENQPSLKKPILQKDSRAFEHQKEFRIYNMRYAVTEHKTLDNPIKEIIAPNQFGATFFTIGSIEDIAETYSINELFSGIEIRIETPIPKKDISKEMWWDGKRYQEV